MLHSSCSSTPTAQFWPFTTRDFQRRGCKSAQIPCSTPPAAPRRLRSFGLLLPRLLLADSCCAARSGGGQNVACGRLLCSIALALSTRRRLKLRGLWLGGLGNCNWPCKLLGLLGYRHCGVLLLL